MLGVLRPRILSLAAAVALALQVAAFLSPDLARAGAMSAAECADRALVPPVRRLIGVLVETRDGPVFHTGDYVTSRHGTLAFEITLQHGPILKAIWGGEIFAVAEQGVPFPGRFQLVNETSEWWLLFQGPKSSNPLEELQARLPEIGSGYFTPETRVIPYDTKNEHLDPEGHRFAKYIRHDLGNDVSAIFNFLESWEESLLSRLTLRRFWDETAARIVTFSEKVGRIVPAIRFMVRERYLPEMPTEDDRLLTRVLEADRALSLRSWNPKDLMRLKRILAASEPERRILTSGPVASPVARAKLREYVRGALGSDLQGISFFIDLATERTPKTASFWEDELFSTIPERLSRAAGALRFLVQEGELQPLQAADHLILARATNIEHPRYFSRWKPQDLLRLGEILGLTMGPRSRAQGLP